MARSKTTSPKVAQLAVAALRDPESPAREKSLAGSVLAQVEHPNPLESPPQRRRDKSPPDQSRRSRFRLQGA
jgi:hypothetical protein